eukprot:3334418-Pyramimonas_sp.AAC.1
MVVCLVRSPNSALMAMSTLNTTTPYRVVVQCPSIRVWMSPCRRCPENRVGMNMVARWMRHGTLSLAHPVKSWGRYLQYMSAYWVLWAV